MKRFASLALLLLLFPASLWAQESEKPEKSFPLQSEAAAKTIKFATVKADDATFKDALPAKDITGAKKLLNKPGKFVGTVAKVYTSQNNSIVILNFDKNFRNALTAVLKPDTYAKFPDMQVLTGRKVLVSGKFVAFKQQIQIELTDPAQIKVVQE